MTEDVLVQSPKSRRALMGIFIFVMCIFFILAYRQEMQAQDLRDTTHRMCVARNVNIERTNRYLAGMIDIERNNPFVATSPETVHRRIALYRSAMLSRIDCGALK